MFGCFNICSLALIDKEFCFILYFSTYVMDTGDTVPVPDLMGKSNGERTKRSSLMLVKTKSAD